MKKTIQNKTVLLARLLVIFFLLSLVPVLLVSFYNHPSYDDYTYGARVHHAISSGGGILAVLSAAIETVISFYYAWQGTFSAIFLFSLQPGVFSDTLYFLTTFILLGSLIGSTLFLSFTVFSAWLKLDKSYATIIGIIVLFTQIQFVPSIREGFFWFNGASYYTLFYCFSLILAALLLRLYLSPDKSKRSLAIPSALVSVIIGGGNYSTALFTICTLSVVCFLLLVKKDLHAKFFFVVLISGIVGLIISMIAPGNAIRAAQQVDSLSPVHAILYSFQYALTYVGQWTTLPEITAMLFLAPFIYTAAHDCSWSFRYPLLVILISFGLFACQLTPPLYAMNQVGGPRQVNVYYYSYLLMLLFDLFYVSGWLAKKHPTAISIKPMWHAISNNIISILIVFLALFVSTCLYRGSKNITTAACSEALISGTAQMYDATVSSNLEALMSTDGVCYVDTVPYCRVFMYFDLDQDPTHWVNNAYANYFGCESVHVVPSPDS